MSNAQEIDRMAQELADLKVKLDAAKAAKGKADREARRAAQRAEEKAHQDRMHAEYAEPFGIPRAVSGKVYSLAWEHGHASGYSEVENYFQDFAGLAQTAYEQGCADGKRAH